LLDPPAFADESVPSIAASRTADPPVDDIAPPDDRPPLPEPPVDAAAPPVFFAFMPLAPAVASTVPASCIKLTTASEILHPDAHASASSVIPNDFLNSIIV
jgi:hypothetical protein